MHTTDRLGLQPLSMNASQGRWRTEAMRAHATPRLMLFHKGQGRITVNGLTRGYGPNNMIFIPARTMYGYELGPTSHGVMVTIPDAMAREWPEEAVHLRLRDVATQKEAAQIIDQMERELRSPRPGAARAAHYHLGLLAVFYQRQLEEHPETATDAREQSAAARLVAAYSDLIERDFRRQPAIAGLARSLGVTPTHLSRACRQTCGRSAHALLNDRILFEARTLLRETRTPVQKIAADLGYGSAAYFTRSFQKATGQTPTGFRREDAGRRS
ncbi:helix-turn-helix transcriptional regulator [Wenxinia marina]|uniref:Transcriptional regulator, AraC family n=1 Tax=Wenxinia marina DSM 24838 TaxID=1123501 RepID=A0A0D0NHE7_9RHOB|nr:AraC family transcriptional regulator [Wenxinia marina]KIQ67730.1 transcriptional regulator, AraC family [Wenxinia marina DSM 24838]GGL77629.1 transcriptional regulator [Wenxinia marina]